MAALLGGLQSASGVKVTPLKALGVATVYACVHVLSRTISTLPLKLYERGIDGKGKHPARDHHLYDLLNTEPNEEMTTVEWRSAMQGNLSLHNNSYAQIVRNTGGKIVELLPLHPSDVKLERDFGTKKLVYKVKGKTLKREEVLHLKNMTRDGLKGMDLISVGADVLGLAVALETNAAKFFANDSKPGTILEHPAKLSDQAYKRLKDSMEKRQGVENAYKMLILEEGLKAASSRDGNRDAQFDESRERQDKQICRLFGLPPHKVQIMTDATYSNIESQSIEFVTDAILPIVVNWEKALDKALLTKEERKKYYFKFDLRALMRGDTESRYKSYGSGIQWGFLSPNDVRRLEDMDPREHGDVYLQPVNMAPSGSVPEQKTTTSNQVKK